MLHRRFCPEEGCPLSGASVCDEIVAIIGKKQVNVLYSKSSITMSRTCKKKCIEDNWLLFYLFIKPNVWTVDVSRVLPSSI